MANEFFHGLIDEVRVYDIALSETEIRADMDTPLSADTEPPVVTLTAPLDGATVSGDVTISADATDNVTSVQFLLDGANLGAEISAAPYILVWDSTTATLGAHVLTAVARDAAGNQATATAVAVTVTVEDPPPGPDTEPPSVAVTAPLDGATVSSDVTISADATDNVAVAGVQFLLDGVNLGAEVTTPPYTLVWDSTTSILGPHSLSTVARDAAGNQTTSAAVAVTVEAPPSGPDTEPPTVAITGPIDGATVAGDVILSADATDNVAVAGVQFLLDGINLGAELTAAPFTLIWDSTTAALGAHELTAVARDSAGNQTTSLIVNVTVAVPSDTEPPAVSLTAPIEGDSVSGEVDVGADATDNVAVAGVQFLLDGANLGAEVTSAPFTLVWDTATATIGDHELTAVARDAAGNQTTALAVGVTVQDPTDPSVLGSWGPVQDLGFVAVHTMLLPSGELLIWDGWEFNTTSTFIWNPQTGQLREIEIQSQLFCAGHSYLADGRLLVTGGHDGGGIGIVDASIFDPFTLQWTRIDDMAFAHWYPSNVTLGDGRVLSIGGQVSPGNWSDVVEVFDPATNTWSLLNALTPTLHDAEYPLTFLLPDGRVFAIAASPGGQGILDVEADTWTDLGPIGLKGSPGMYLPGQIVYAGGGAGGETSPSHGEVYVINFNEPDPQWRQTSSMSDGRYEHNLVVLPDGKVLAIGGVAVLSQASNDGSATPEVWDPATETWTTLAPMVQPRPYHSTALLLPDATVFIGGGGALEGALDYTDAEIFSPPYLFNGPRPVITSAPDVAAYGATINAQTPDAATVVSASLVGLAARTHMLDMNQRFVPLTIAAGATDVAITLPTNPNLAPPGYYMLFLVNADGVPSMAHIVRLTNSSDFEAPAVEILSPVADSTVQGVLLISATPTDNDAVGGVTFMLDGLALGSEVTAAPYEIVWNTVDSTDGLHTLTAIARDPSGNRTTSAEIQVTVDNSAAPTLPAGLVAAFSFNEGLGIVALDATGNANHGSISGAAWDANGKHGGALRFDGIDDWLTISDSPSLDLTNGMTISAWVSPITLSGWDTILIKERPFHIAYALYANTGGNIPSGEIRLTNNHVVLGDSQVAIGAWTHLTTTFDGTALKFYLNGNLIRTVLVSGTIFVSDDPFRIGGNSIWADEFFHGLIDEVRVYNRALTPAEILADMDTPLP